MMRWILLVLVALNLVYLAFGLYRAHHFDPYTGVAPPQQQATPVREIRLLDSLVDTPPHPETRLPDGLRQLPEDPRQDAVR